ncbi:Mvd [Symbiodinium microadriaticum]|nr:Mvd [Symbiodinium microadriaticum]
MGTLGDGTDSIAQQIADENHWPELRAVILVVSDREKDTSSTAGMQTSIQTSPLLRFRADEVVESRLRDIENAYLHHDFETFGRITMQDSNQFHATCLDTYPPIFYMNDVSRMIIRIVHVINDFYGCIKLAYTFDAGPNAVVYCLEEESRMFMSVVSKYFPAAGDYSDYCNDGRAFESAVSSQSSLPIELLRRLDMTGRVPQSGDVKYVFLTRAGPGPQCLDSSQAMLDTDTGLPNEVGRNIKRMKVSSEPAKECNKSTHCCKTGKIAVSCVIGAACVALGYLLAGRCQKR